MVFEIGLVRPQSVNLQQADGTLLPAELHIGEAPPDQVRLRLSDTRRDIEAVADDYSSAMCQIRTILEADALLLTLYGASLNVYPSGMARQMGDGEKAYKLTTGQPARLTDLVSIFDSGPDVNPATVTQQQNFYHAWLESLNTKESVE